jgi:hypothetical protein
MNDSTSSTKKPYPQDASPAFRAAEAAFDSAVGQFIEAAYDEFARRQEKEGVAKSAMAVVLATRQAIYVVALRAADIVAAYDVVNGATLDDNLIGGALKVARMTMTAVTEQLQNEHEGVRVRVIDWLSGADMTAPGTKPQGTPS